MKKKQLLAVLLTASMANPSSVIALATGRSGLVAYADEVEGGYKPSRQVTAFPI